MARSAGDAALDFEMRMLLDTKEAEASAKRLESALDGVLKVFGSIGKAATGALGMVAAVLKAPADLDNYLGSLNTKITTMNGHLDSYRKIVESMTGKKRGPDDLMFGFSPEDFQKVQMNFARGASETEKYSKDTAKFQQQFGQGVGGLVKFIGTNTEDAARTMTSFHRELGISYKEMGEFSKNLGALNKMSGLTADQNLKLYRTVTSIGRAYGKTGSQAQTFVKDSVAVGYALSKIGLDAESMLRRMNEVASGSEQGLIQSLLLGFKPGDQSGMLKSFKEQAKMITEMAANAGEQFAPFLTRQLADSLGMKDFSVEEIKALSNGTYQEKGDKTELVDVVDVLKGLQGTMEEQGKATENFYATSGQAVQQKLSEGIGWLQTTFWAAFQELKKKIMDFDLTGLLNKIRSFFGGDGPSLTELGMAAGALALAPMMLKMVVKTVATFITSPYLLTVLAGSVAGMSVGTFTKNLSKELGVDKLLYAIMDIPVRALTSTWEFISTLFKTGDIKAAVKAWWAEFDFATQIKQMFSGIGQALMSLLKGVSKIGSSLWEARDMLKFWDPKAQAAAGALLSQRFGEMATSSVKNAYNATQTEVGGVVQGVEDKVRGGVSSVLPRTAEKVNMEEGNNSPASGLAQAMARQEGWYEKGSTPNQGQRNNNPGNLRVGMENWASDPATAQRIAEKQLAKGYDPKTGFLQFANAEAGWKGLDRQLGLFAERGETVGSMVPKYAPKGDGTNSPEHYLKGLEKLGYSANMPVADALKSIQGKSTKPEGTSDVKDTTTHGLLKQIAENTRSNGERNYVELPTHTGTMFNGGGSNLWSSTGQQLNDTREISYADGYQN